MEKAELIQIVQKSKDGDMEAMEKLLLHAHTSVSYQCRKMLKSEQDVEDMTQEILVTVYQKLDALQEPAAFNQWLKKITAARCINALTRTHVEYQFAEDEEGHSILDTLEEMDEKKIPDQWLDNKETTRMIEDIVNGLPEAQRLCTLMFYYSEMSVKEMSHVLKVSENTVKSRLNYARKAIKEKVLDYEKQGIKLYGISPLPFLFYFLHKLEKESKNPAVAQVMVDEILAESSMVAAAGAVAAGSAGAAATGTAAATAAGVTGATAATAATASGGILTAIFSAIPMKIIAGVTAAAVTIGGVAAVDALVKTTKTEQTESAVLEEIYGGDRGEEVFFLENAETGTTPPEESAVDEETLPEETVPEETKTAASNSIASETQKDSASGNDSSADDGSSSSGNTDTSGEETPEEEQIPTEHQHSYDIAYEIPATCTAEGKAGYQCACGEKSSDIEILNDLGHKYRKVNNGLLCTESGTRIYKCENCGNSYEQTDTSGGSHIFIENVVAPSDTQAGYTEFVCTNCSYSYRDECASHNWYGDHQIGPYCTEEGYISLKCVNCGAIKIGQYLEPTGHSWGEWVETVAPTLTEQGRMERTCSKCGGTEAQSIAKLQENHVHFYEPSVTKESTCNTYGTMTYSCTCGNTYTENIPMNEDHMYYMTEYAGFMRLRCSICGILKSSSEGHSHSYIGSTTNATCITGGYTTYTCTYNSCNDAFLADETDPMGHSYETTVVDPTETEEGYTEYVCSVCGDSYRDHYTDPITSVFSIQPERDEEETTEEEITEQEKPSNDGDPGMQETE